MPFYPIIACDEFTPNLAQWTGVGNVQGFTRQGAVISLQMQQGPAPQLTVLSESLFRLRFNPTANYTRDDSYAVINKNFGAFALNVQDQGVSIEITTQTLRIVITKAPFSLAVFRGALFCNPPPRAWWPVR